MPVDETEGFGLATTVGCDVAGDFDEQLVREREEVCRGW